MLTARNTLVLNHKGLPHSVITWQEAVTGLFDQVSAIYYVIAEYDEEISSPSITIQKPAVVGLFRVLNGVQCKVSFNRNNMLLRDEFRCQYCGERPGANKLTYDHVLPKYQGGRRCYENIVMACEPCNNRKGGRTPEQAGMTLLRQPFIPRSLPLSARLDERVIPEEWRQVLPGNAA